MNTLTHNQTEVPWSHRSDVSARRSALEARRAWVSRARAELAHDAARAPWLFVGLLAAIPVGWLWGSVAAALVAVALGLFAYMAVYVVWVHRREYHGEFESVSSQLAELDRPREVREKAHWRTPSKPAHL